MKSFNARCPFFGVLYYLRGVCFTPTPSYPFVESINRQTCVEGFSERHSIPLSEDILLQSVCLFVCLFVTLACLFVCYFNLYLCYFNQFLLFLCLLHEPVCLFSFFVCFFLSLFCFMFVCLFVCLFLPFLDTLFVLTCLSITLFYVDS